MHERLPDGSQVFRASWRGGTARLATFILLLGLLMAWWALSDGDAPLALWGFAAFFGGLGLLLFKPVLSRLPVLSVGPQGVSGQLTRGHTVPWSDITDVEHVVVQGNEVLSLVLRPGSPLLAPTRPLIGRGLKRGLSRTATIEGVAPSWFFEVLRADLALREGTISLVERTRSVDAAVDRMAAAAQAKAEAEPCSIAVHGYGNRRAAEALADYRSGSAREL